MSAAPVVRVTECPWQAPFPFCILPCLLLSSIIRIHLTLIPYHSFYFHFPSTCSEHRSYTCGLFGPLILEGMGRNTFCLIFECCMLGLESHCHWALKVDGDIAAAQNAGERGRAREESQVTVSQRGVQHFVFQTLQLQTNLWDKAQQNAFRLGSVSLRRGRWGRQSHDSRLALRHQSRWRDPRLCRYSLKPNGSNTFHL